MSALRVLLALPGLDGRRFAAALEAAGADPRIANEPGQALMLADVARPDAALVYIASTWPGGADLARALRRRYPRLRLLLLGRSAPLEEEVLPERVFNDDTDVDGVLEQLSLTDDTTPSLLRLRLAWFPERMPGPALASSERVAESHRQLRFLVADEEVDAVVLSPGSGVEDQELVADLRALSPALSLIVASSQVAPFVEAGASSVLPVGVDARVIGANLRQLNTAVQHSVEERDPFALPVLASIEQALLVARGEPPRLLWWNAALERRLGYSSSELRGRPLEQIEAPVGESLAALAARVRLGVRPPPAEIALRTRLGEMHRAVAVVGPLPGGEVLFALHSLEVSGPGPTAERRDNLARLGQTAAGIAHEVRNSLAAVGGPLEVIQRQLPEGDRIRPVLGRVRARLRQTSDMLDELLGYARPVTLRPVPVDARLVLGSAVQAALSQEGDAVDIEVDLPEDPVVFLADPGLVARALQNLVLNALQCGDGARVHTSARAVGGFVLFDVQDEGPGVPMELRERIFDPFVTTRSGGTGLGLPMVRKVIERHGGTVSLRPSEHGAWFRIALPRQAGLQEELP